MLVGVKFYLFLAQILSVRDYDEIHKIYSVAENFQKKP